MKNISSDLNTIVYMAGFISYAYARRNKIERTEEKPKEKHTHCFFAFGAYMDRRSTATSRSQLDENQAWESAACLLISTAVLCFSTLESEKIFIDKEDRTETVSWEVNFERVCKG